MGTFLELLPEDLKRETERKVTSQKMLSVMDQLEHVTRDIRKVLQWSWCTQLKYEHRQCSWVFIIKPIFVCLDEK
jgi:hypothetical protein